MVTANNAPCQTASRGESREGNTSFVGSQGQAPVAKIRAPHPAALRNDLVPIPGGDELRNVPLVGRHHGDVGRSWSKRERLGGKYHINVKIFEIRCRSPLLPCRCPKLCG